MKWIIRTVRILLFPMALLYGLVMQLRNKLYDWQIFKTNAFAVPVISVGNITAGGTGKTPFTIFLARKLSAVFPRIAVVSRGYGRQSRGVQLVADGQKIILDPDRAGDEPYLIAQKLPGVIVVVSEKRSRGIQFLLGRFEVDLIILDDAFQHRAVKRDLDILLINASEPFRYNLPLPAGTLREFAFNYRRADLAIFTKQKKNQPGRSAAEISIPAYSSRANLDSLTDLGFNECGLIETLSEEKIWAFAGIAHPEDFKNGLMDRGLDIGGFTAFKDHHKFEESDLTALHGQAVRYNCSVMLCTEKDLVKIKTLAGYWDILNAGKIKLLAVSQTVDVDDEDLFIKKIQDRFDIN